MKGIASSPYNCMKFLVNDHIRSELIASHNKATERKTENCVGIGQKLDWKEKNDDNKISDDDN